MSSAIALLRVWRDEARPGRRGTAAVLRNLVDAAAEPESYWRRHGIQPPLRSAAVLAAADDLLAVADRLESGAEISTPLVECAAWLAWAPDSPVCSQPAPDADVPQIAARLRAALA